MLQKYKDYIQSKLIFLTRPSAAITTAFRYHFYKTYGCLRKDHLHCSQELPCLYLSQQNYIQVNEESVHCILIDILCDALSLGQSFGRRCLAARTEAPSTRGNGLAEDCCQQSPSLFLQQR